MSTGPTPDAEPDGTDGGEVGRTEGRKRDRTRDAEPATDRRVTTAEELDSLAWNERGLVPVVTQDAATGDVLMVAWANREALERTLETGDVHLWSRSREELWRKGETSGNVLRLRSLHADCDADTVLALVSPTGPACHTGDVSCFGRGTAPRSGADATGALSTPDAPTKAVSDPDAEVLVDLWRVIDERAATLPEDSYTTKLLTDENLRLKKLGEETTELVMALVEANPERTADEAADLLYHLLAALRGADVSLTHVLEALERRRG